MFEIALEIREVAFHIGGMGEQVMNARRSIDVGPLKLRKKPFHWIIQTKLGNSPPLNTLGPKANSALIKALARSLAVSSA